jgi:hypothetical protein
MADDNKDDKTQAQPLRPPMPKAPQGQPAAPKTSGEGEHTVLGGGPPRIPQPPGAPSAAKPAADEGHTIFGGGPPGMPKAPAPPAPGAPAPQPAAPPPQASAPPPPSASDDDEGATVIMTRSTKTPCSLQRLQPPGHGSEVVSLTADSYVMGRSRTCDIQLYSPSASRSHARLVKRGAEWFLQPEEGRAVLAGGSTVKDEVRLVQKLRLQLGGDELLFFDENAAVAAPAATPSAAGGAEAKGGSRTMMIVGIVVVVVAIAAVAAWLFLKP